MSLRACLAIVGAALGLVGCTRAPAHEAENEPQLVRLLPMAKTVADTPSTATPVAVRASAGPPVPPAISLEVAALDAELSPVPTDLRCELAADGRAVSVRGLAPRAVCAWQRVDPPVVLGWLAVDEDGVGTLAFEARLPPGGYLLVRPGGTRAAVVVPGDRAAWRATAAARYAEVRALVRSALGALERAHRAGASGEAFLVGRERALDEPRWREALSGELAALAAVEAALATLRSELLDLADPDAHHRAFEAARLGGCYARALSRDLYLRCRRDPHPDDVDVPGDPLCSLAELRRRIATRLVELDRAIDEPVGGR